MKVKSLSAINPPEHIAKVIGTKKGRLMITAFAGRYDHRYYVIVKCECGEEKIVNASNLLWGTTVSCGCYNSVDKFKDKKERLMKAVRAKYSTLSYIKKRA